MSEGAGQLELRETPVGVELWVQVTPRAARSELAEVEGGALRVRVTAPPVEGAANRALVDLLSESLGLPARRIRLIAGGRSRRKRVLIEGLRADELRARLAARAARTATAPDPNR
ncbi:hypothetical protein HRbin26_01522 [bacterium HR26]|nr:hypothetical protein HRbin26_01522 [bacterium HR26]